MTISSGTGSCCTYERDTSIMFADFLSIFLKKYYLHAIGSSCIWFLPVEIDLSEIDGFSVSMSLYNSRNRWNLDKSGLFCNHANFLIKYVNP